MALVTPLLMVILFGAFELGNYFLSEHVVSKAVRDGARFASRQSLTDMPCNGTATSITQIRNLVRFGNIAGTGNPRLAGWTNPATVTVQLSCAPASTYSGIYLGMTSTIPVVTVSADVPYSSLFNALGFSSATLRLRAQSQAAVAGS